MVEEIITALSRIRWLFVIARNSTLTYKGQPIDVKQVGRELGVRYVLEGSVRKAGGRVRITAQLIDATNGAHLWADRFDGLLEDVFELQDKVAASVAGVIEPTMQAAEIRRSTERPTNDLTAYDLYLRASPIYSSMTNEGIREALELMEQAIARDPRYGPALALAALCHTRLQMEGWSSNPEVDRRKGVDRARRALHVAGNDPEVLANAAYALARLGEDIGAMMALLDSSLALNPSFARAWYLSGGVRLSAGQLDTAIEHLETSLRLNPRGHHFGSLPLYMMGVAFFAGRRFEEAAAKLLQAIQVHPAYPGSYRFLAACYAHMGRLDEAREVVHRLKELTPALVPSSTLLQKPEHRELLLSGLRLAVGEEK
jgi:tetratricopeptide (TPR) repeat protein